LSQAHCLPLPVAMLNVKTRTLPLLSVLIGVVRAEMMSLSEYTRSSWPLDGVRFYWRFVQDDVVVDAESTMDLGDDAVFEFAISVPAVDGWIGFGVGETTSGSMPGADIVLSYIDDSGLQVGDYFTTDFVRPEEDCTQPSDWEAGGYERNSTHTTVALQRLVGASGDHDRDISTRADGARLLFAYGDFDTDFAYHGSQRAMSTVVLHGPVASLETSDTVFAWDITQENFSVPTDDTTYANTACSVPPAGDAFMIGYEVVVSSDSMKPHLHHFLLHGFTDVNCSSEIPYTLLGVASKHDPVVFPNDTAMPFRFASYSVEVHYDNPLMLSGLVDSSGLRLFYSYEQPTHALGMLSVGDPLVQTGHAIPAGLSYWPYYCPSDCTTNWNESITIIGGMPHMHSVGAAMRTEFYDADYTSLLGTHDAEYYSFDTQHTAFLEEPIVVPSGSNIVTTCVFDTETSMAFGLASSEEMCIHFLLYYPALEHIFGSFCGEGICGGLYGAGMVDDVSRSFGSSCSSSSTTEASADESGSSTTEASADESDGSTTEASADESDGSTTEATSLAAACALHTAAISVFFVGAHFGPTL